MRYRFQGSGYGVALKGPHPARSSRLTPIRALRATVQSPSAAGASSAEQGAGCV